MSDKHEYQKGMSPRLSGSDAESVGGKDCVDLRNQQQAGFFEDR